MTSSLAATSLAVALLGLCCGQRAQGQPTLVGGRGLTGYISYVPSSPPAGFGAGMSFYSAVWPLSEEPLYLQMGLAGSWITPNNSDNTTIPLAPVGTYARENFPERGPTYQDVFQTLEGGLGYWGGNQFQYGQPKFSMNSTPQCYDYEIATPGFSFFQGTQALADDRLGVAQVSNRLLIPPDALPFSGNPNGQFLGYAYMALPFTDATPENTVTSDPPTGDQAWTCFLSTANFKGPIAFYIPETWSKIGKLFNYPFIYGRGLDTKPGIATGGAIEINTIPAFENVDSLGVKYAKIPKLQFPVDEFSQTLLVQDVTYYSKSALYDGFKSWRDGGALCTGVFDPNSAYKSTLYRQDTYFGQREQQIVGIENVFNNRVYPGNTWGLEWKANAISPKGTFPQYYKEVNGQRIPISAAEVPSETGLLTAEFPRKPRGGPFTSPTVAGAWTQPGPVRGPFTVKLLDGSKVTYSWYRFIDQPSFKQYAWSAQKKAMLQAIVEQIHINWPINRDYMAPLQKGELASLDPGLFVQPPLGLEVGYVPIVTRQEDAGDTTAPTPNPMTFAVSPAPLGPNSVTMTATTASDAAGPVTYRFENTTTGVTSGWSGSSVWTEKGLSAAANSYRVKARDTSLNETSWSAVVTAPSAALVPVIAALSPADNAVGVALSAQVAIAFSRPISAGSGFITLKNLTDHTQTQINITDTSRISIAGATLTIDPRAFLATGKKVAIRIDATAIKDASNNPFVGISDDTVWNFQMASSGVVSTGGTKVYTDENGLNPRSTPPYVGGYVVQKFPSSSPLTVAAGGNVEYLVVAGGGGGGMRHGGGGGGGGVLAGTTNLTAGTYTTIVGGGGAAGDSNDEGLKAGGEGSDSALGDFIARGGGGGRTFSGGYTGDGASGGGGAGGSNATGGSGISGQGNAGGSGSTTASGSGGGGAGGAGFSGTPDGGKGGAGVISSISGTATYYGGGGGGGGNIATLGGSGGTGGGGHGGDNGVNTNQTAGTSGTGGGGGGCRSSDVTATGSAGGSGIVIMRYALPAPQLVRSAFVDDKNGGSTSVNSVVNYTVTFSEDMDAASVTAGDFSNAGTSTIVINSVTETTPGVFTVQATPTTVGTLQLQVPAGAILTNGAGSPVDTRAAILDNTTLGVGISPIPPGYALDFLETFSGNSVGPYLTPGTGYGTPTTNFTGAFTITSGLGSRIYLGTNKTNYSSVNFVFEADVTVPVLNEPSSIAFMGMGRTTPVGGNSYGEPLTIPHVGMLVRNDENQLDARDNSPNGTANDFAVNNVGITVGTHRIRMSWDATTKLATFAIDLGNNGSYDSSFTVNGADNGFTATNSQLYLGGGNGLSFDNVSVYIQTPTAALKITSITKSGTMVNVGFEGIAGLTYQLNKSTNLNFTTPNIKSTLTLTGTAFGSLQDTNATEPAAFYRVETK